VNRYRICCFYEFYLLCSILIFSSALSAKSKFIDSLNIGVVVPLSGSLVNFTYPIRAAIKIALTEIRLHDPYIAEKIVIHEIDSRSDPDILVRNLPEIIQYKKLRVLICCLSMRLTQKVIKLTKKTKLLHIIPHSLEKASSLSKQIFPLLANDAHQIQVVADFLIEHLKASKVLILYDQESPYSIQFKEKLGKRMNLLRKGMASFFEIGFLAQNQKTKKKHDEALLKNFDVLFAALYGLNLRHFLSFYSQYNFTQPLVIGDAWDPQSLGTTQNNFRFPLYFLRYYHPKISTPENNRFVRTYQKQTGKDPGFLSAIFYDSLMLAAQVYKQARSTRFNALVRTARKISQSPTLLGELSWNTKRIGKRPYIFLKTNGHQIISIYPIPPR